MWSDAALSLSLSCTPVSDVGDPLTSSSCRDGSQLSGKWRGGRSAPVLSWKRVDCPQWVREQLQQELGEFKYLQMKRAS